jgi:hypothetical protein
MDELSFRLAREESGERDELLALAINLKIDWPPTMPPPRNTLTT